MTKFRKLNRPTGHRMSMPRFFIFLYKIGFDHADIEGNAQNGPVVRLPFASLFDTLG
ncbi:hypothetical protein Gotur_033324, partial [Gossypium turneri]